MYLKKNISKENIINRDIDNIIEDSVKLQIPNKLKEYFQSEENKKLLLQKFGEDAFLLPEELKFPVINPFTGKIDCKLLYSARIRLRQFSKNKQYIELSKKAESIYRDNECNENVNVKIEECDNIIDLADVLELIEY